jgi:hypothetical protein
MTAMAKTTKRGIPGKGEGIIILRKNDMYQNQKGTLIPQEGQRVNKQIFHSFI